MPSAVRLREDYSAEELRALARRSKTINQSRRLLSLAAVRDGLERGSAATIGRSCMFNLIGQLPDVRALLEVDGAHVHLYGKAARPGRKLGHVTVWAENAAMLEERVERVRRGVGAERYPKTPLSRRGEVGRGA